MQFSLTVLWRLLWIHLLHLGVVNCARSAPRSIKIAGVFEPEYENLELVFRYAINRVNQRRDLLPITTLNANVETVPKDDSFLTARKVCDQLNSGIAAVFGPISGISASHVQSICDHVAVPHIETRWQSSYEPKNFAINVHPYHETMSDAFLDYVMRNEWKQFTILYDDTEGIIRLQSLLKMAPKYNFKITLRELTPTYSLNHGADYRPVLKDMKLNRETKIILHCALDTMQTVLHQAKTAFQMTTSYYHYVLTTEDMGLLNLEDYQHDGVNITGFQLVDQTKSLVSEVASDWVYQEISTGKSPLANRKGISTQAALLYDAVYLFATAFDDYVQHARDVSSSENLSCDSDITWPDGEGLMNVLSMTEIDGLTGRVKFDHTGKRTDFILDVIELTTEGQRKSGIWSAITGLNITETFGIEDTKIKLQNSTLVVTTILEDPYVMWKNRSDGQHHVGNDRFEGYCVDLLDAIATMLGFNYTIKLVDDGQYGAPTGDTGEWTGMVKELMDGTADLVVASLTISYVREQVIDFTKPFMNLGISILYKKPEKQNPHLFSFLSPLSFDVWGYVLAAYLGVSFMLFVLARFSPYEWTNPHPCNEDSDIVENQFNVLNSLWFTIGSLMQQGCDIMPKSSSTRLVSTLWWFFTLIIISSYTANLAAFLTVERMTVDIESADDLAKQTAIHYGPVYGGSTMTFFKETNQRTYNIMWKFMSKDMSNFVKTTENGLMRVNEGNYAFIGESTMLEYAKRADCRLVLTKGYLLSNVMYGMGTSTIETYARMWNFMQTTKPSVYVNSTPEGIDRVLKGGYAYLLESTMNEYITRRNCDLMQVGGLLDSKGYGIGTPQGSPYRDAISEAILKLQESQRLQILYDKWWKEKGVAAVCDADESKGDASALGIANVGGVFVVLIGGLVLAVFLAIIEFVYNARKNADEDKQSLCSEMLEELRFAIWCFGGDTKTLKKKGSMRTSSNTDFCDNNETLTPLTSTINYHDNSINHNKMNHFGLPDTVPPRGNYT